MFKKSISLLAVIILTGCTSSVGSSNGANGIQVAQKEDMRKCKFLGDVHGISSFYGIFAASALEDSREAAMIQAKKLGATHIVWERTNTNYGSTSIDGNAYNCVK